MSMIEIQNVAVAFGGRDIFTGITASVPDDGKIGLIGPNGVGKTSLLRVIAGVAEPSAGRVERGRACRVGYLRQEAVEAFAGHDHTIYDEMLTVFAPLRAQAAELRAMEARMATGDSSAELLARYGSALDTFEHAGGYDYEVGIGQVLEGLGFTREQWDTPMGHLSGGQKTRALLARLLLERPTLLILDEPTNHLDVQAVEWLESALRSWAGALLVVSHDRYFLDRVVDRVWEMSATHIDSYRGNYTAYAGQREERWERNTQLFEAERQRLHDELELIKRYIGWRRFDEAKGKQKRLSRQLVAIEEHGPLALVENKSWSEMGVGRVHMMTVEELHAHIKAITSPFMRPPTLKMRLKPTSRGGTMVLRAVGLRVGYPGTPLFDVADLEVERLDRVALIGPNGSGKTTFLRTVLGQVPPLEGEVRLGAGLKIGYFAQAHEALDLENSVLDELLRHREMTLGEARNYLAHYLFRDEDVFKPVGALSGGERGRLALAILAVEGVNVLLLDEPTNHLDIPAQEVLQEVLERFDGTLLLVSHDRYLVDRLATQVWELRDGRLHVFEGSYAEMLAAREREAAAAREVAEPRPRPPAVQQRSEARDAAATVSSLEERIAAAEALLARHTQQLQDESEAGNYAEVTRLGREFARTQELLDSLLAEWAALAET